MINILKISKLFISMVLCCFAVCLLSGCESEETKLKNISDLITRFSSGEEISDNDIQIYKSYYEDVMFEKTVCQELDAFNKDSDYAKVISLLTVLDDDRIDYQSEKVNKKVSETIEKLKKEYLSIAEIKDIDTYLTKVEPFVSLYSFTKDVEDIYGTAEIIGFVQQNGTKIITKDGAGGYFDSRKGSYQDSESGYYDPLSNKYVSYGEVGTYKTRTSYQFYGDI